MEWISVNDRLPEDRTRVLVADERDGYVGIATMCLYYNWDPHSKDKLKPKWSWNKDSYDIDEFTHWMLLPEPPPKEDA